MQRVTKKENESLESQRASTKTANKSASRISRTIKSSKTRKSLPPTSIAPRLGELWENEAGTSTQALRPRPKEATINLKRCMYKIVEDVATLMGMGIVRDDEEPWDVYWSDFSVSTVMSKSMEVYHRINHFPGMANLESKAFLAYHLNRMRNHFPEDYDFYPRSWSLPYQQEDFLSYVREHPHQVFISKPSRGAEGKGIKIFNTLEEARGIYTESVSQLYMSNLLLMDGFKFDLRVYVLITCIDPLRIFVYNNGLVRLATCQYTSPETGNLTNQYMHLTNYSVNKSSENYNKSPERGSKRDFTALNSWLLSQGLNSTKLWNDIDDIIIKTIISVYPILKEKYEDLLPEHYHHNVSASFEILGFDILIDSTMKPFLLEVNRSPSFNIAGIVDERVKRTLIYDTFKILNLNQNRKSILFPSNDDSENQSSNSQFGSTNDSNDMNFSTPTRHEYHKGKITLTSDDTQSYERSKSQPSSNDIKHSKITNSAAGNRQKTVTIKEQIKWETRHLGNYRLIYPNNESYTYSKFIHYIFTVPEMYTDKKRTQSN